MKTKIEIEIVAPNSFQYTLARPIERQNPNINRIRNTTL